jgi:RNA polymerase sigma factor (sigma-70 family)
MARSDLREALEKLHAECAGWALSCCDYDRDEADDVLQSSYLKVLDGRAVHGGRSSFKTWLFGVVRMTAGEQRRRRILRRFLLPRLLDGESTQARPDALRGIEDADESRRLTEALRELPRRQREVLHLVFYQDMTIEESALVLRISLGTARTHYERGKARMRNLLGREAR